MEDVVRKAVNRISLMARRFNALEAPGRSGLDARAENMAKKVSAMLGRVARMLDIAYCLTRERCHTDAFQNIVCGMSSGRLYLTYTGRRLIMTRLTDIKAIEHVENNSEWQIALWIRQYSLSTSGEDLRICLHRTSCIDVKPDMDYIKDNYSDIRYYVGEIDTLITRLLSGLEHQARLTMPTCIRQS